MFKSISILALSVFLLLSCNNSPESSTEATRDTTTVDTASAFIVVDDAYIMPPAQENSVAGIHMNKRHHDFKKIGRPTDLVDAEIDYVVVPVDVFVAAAADSGLVVLPPKLVAPVAKDSITVTKSATVLSDDQTVIELGKKGQTSSMEVISDPKDPNTIDEIVFTDKNHTDVYNVQAGMSAKDVRKLRKDMKHMVKKGKVYMYSDDSNIMYQMTTTDSKTKTSYTATEVDEMSVDAIVWKNPKGKKKSKKAAATN